MTILRSRDNARVKRWAKLSQDTRFRKRQRGALVGGPHLVAALLERGLKPLSVIVSENGAENAEIRALIQRSGQEPVVLSAGVFGSIADAEAPQGIAAEIEIPPAKEASKGNRVFLEGLQDAGNVGAIIRSAAAFGIVSVVLDSACADPCSPQALRAGMGGHFALQISTVADLTEQLGSFAGKLVCTVPRIGISLKNADLSVRLGWVFGSEGKSLSP